jgi:transaldolase
LDLAARKGLCDNVTGVTTNPILLEKAKVACHVKSLAVLANHAFELGAKEVQLQTWGGSVKELVATGSELANIDSSIVVHISTSLISKLVLLFFTSTKTCD